MRPIMQIPLDLRPGITETDAYKAFKFPGGEIHFKLKQPIIDYLNQEGNNPVHIVTELTSSDAFMFLAIVTDTIAETWDNYVSVNIGYMPYQQADRKFSDGECFSLKTITKMMNNMAVNAWHIFDPHSDVTPALLDVVHVEDNSRFIEETLAFLQNRVQVILSPDAGAYKKIYKLAEKIKYRGDIECANKYRDTRTGDLAVRLSREDFEGKNILIIDDICMGGRTFIELAKLLKDKNVGKLYLAVSHGIFSNGFEELHDHFEQVFTTNSRKHVSPKSGASFLKILELI